MAYTNLAQGKTTTCSNTITNPAYVTDGSITTANYADGGAVGLTYAQVDLGTIYWLDMVKVWHYYGDLRTYYATKTQVSADGVNWVTIFDSAITGTYVETAYGVTHRFITQPVRYIRDYVNGSTANAANHWVEIQGYGYSDYSTTLINSFLRGKSRSRGLQNSKTGINATGGTITFDGNYIIHTFYSNGTFESLGSGNCEVLVVAGGGGGGGHDGGGGGAGGLIYQTSFAITKQSYIVTVGNGGLGCQHTTAAGSNGGNSVFSSLTAIGGGGGGSRDGSNGTNGGCGGGAGSSNQNGFGTGSQGYNGGQSYTGSPYNGGGGGGMGSIGGNASSVAGKGGNGIGLTISGSLVYYSGGGGGGSLDGTAGSGTHGGGNGGSNTVKGSNAVANTGSGGGGGGRKEQNADYGGNGGSGIVIIRYPVNSLI